MASKYDPLGRYLAAQDRSEVAMTFSEIEKVTGVPLPEKSSRYPAWWSNNASNSTMTKVWIDAGYRTERVDIGARRLVFRRVGKGRNMPEAPPQTRPAQSARTSLLERVRASFAGTVHVNEGVDLTDPTVERWQAHAS
jgi:hypothetical protein